MRRADLHLHRSRPGRPPTGGAAGIPPGRPGFGAAAGVRPRFQRALLAAAGAALLSVAAGCQRPSAASPQPERPAAQTAEPAVRLVKPERKTVRRPIEQPGFNVEAFQQTPLYAKIS